ncbi:hypothetical protein C2W62_02350 [Candidatus Entotheonella serta]|nr:hypothetical protein C2W62_02350 [Candidatus Entotheonella serta]
MKGLRTMKHMLLGVSVALGVSLSVAISGHAFSIGEMKVQSHLHAPFVAEVPLILKPHERDQGFVAVIGDEQDYQAEGVTRMPVIEALRPSIILGASNAIRIISNEPIDVKAFDLLLLVRTGKVTIIQNYPVALKPDPQTAPIVVETTSPAMTAPPVSGPLTQAPQVKSEASRKAMPPAADWLAGLPFTYGPILHGEILYKVMIRLNVPKPYVWQTAVRIWEHNQSRFVRGNLHGLQIGGFLDIPQDLRHSLPKISRREAQQIVTAQWDLWQKPAQMVVASTATKATEIGKAAEPAPVKPPAQPPESLAFAPEPEIPSAVNMATLESMLQGFERRLA